MNIYKVLLLGSLLVLSYFLGKSHNLVLAIVSKYLTKFRKVQNTKQRLLEDFEQQIDLLPQNLNSFLKLSKMGSWLYEVNSRKLFINSTFAEIIGYENSEVITLEDFLGMLNSSNDLQSLIAFFDKTINSQKEHETVVELKNRNQDVIPLRIRMLKSQNKAGASIIIGNIQIIEFSNSEQLLRENFRVLIENTSDGIYIFDKDDLIYVSENLKKDFEPGFFDNNVITTQQLLEYVHIDDLNAVREKIAKSEADKLRKYILKFRLVSKLNRIVYREDVVLNLYDDQNEIARTIIIAKDLTELHQARQNINIEALFNLNIVDSFPGFLLVKNYDGKYIFGNKNASKVLGVAQDQIFGLDDNAYTKDKTMVQKYLEDDRMVIDNKKSIIIEKEKGTRISGEDGYFQAIKIPVDIVGEEKGCVMVFSFDITQKILKEERAIIRKNAVENQTKILLELIEKDFTSESFYVNCQWITEAITKGMGISCASLWEIKGNELISVDFYCTSQGLHQSINFKENKNWGPYLELFTDQLELIISDNQDEQYSYLPEVAKDYFDNFNIRSSLDIPLRLGDDFRGLLCCENDTPQHWSNYDIAYAKYLGNLVLTLWEQEQRMKAQQVLLEKNRILKVSTEISQILQNTINFEEVLITILAKIGQALHTSRAYYFVNDLARGSFKQIGEWVQEGVKSEISNILLQDLKYEKIGKYYYELIKGKSFQFVISDINEQEHFNRLHDQNILSQLVIPIMDKENLLGYLGFDDCEKERTWSEYHLDLLLTIGSTIGTALQKNQSEKANIESQRNFNQISDTLEEVFWLFDVEKTQFLFISKACFEVFGVTEEEGYRDYQFIEKLIYQQDQIKIEERKNSFIVGLNNEINYRITTPEGRSKEINEKITPIFDENGKLNKISGIARDVTSKVESENEIKRLSVVAQNINNGVLIADIEGKVLWANQAYLKLFEAEMVDLIGRRPSEVFQNDDLDISNLSTNVSSNPHELRVKTFKGRLIWIELNSTVILDSNGKPSQVVEIVNNIEERKRNELRLRENESRLRFITDNTSDGFMIFRESEISYYSSQCERLFGYNWSEVEKLSALEIFNFIHTEDLKVLNKLIEDIPQMLGKDIHAELRVRHKSGHYLWVECVVNVVLGDNNHPLSSVVVVRNIDARKNMELAFSKNKQGLKLILNSLDEVVWAREYPSLRPLFVSESIKNIYGISSHDWMLDIFDLNEFAIHDDRNIIENLLLCLKENGFCTGTFRIKDSRGILKWIFTSIKIVSEGNENSNMIIGILKDVTKIKEVEIETQKAKYETEIAQNAYSELELRALQMQMNPHFIFNALNSIQSYIINKEEQMANIYLTKFAALIRQFLESSRSKYISLDEEISNLKLYVELEKLRFENKFDYVFEFDPKLNKYSEIPTMLLQPFIENAINHGLRYKSSKGVLKVCFIDSGKDILIKIEDNGVGRKAAEKIKSLSSQGYKSQGLQITTQRIENYNKLNLENIKYKISDLLENSENIGTLVEIYFPKI